MLIACAVGENGEVADLFEAGRLCLFSEGEGVWAQQAEFPLELGQASLSALKDSLRRAVLPLEGCKVFLLKDLRGVFRAFLEEFGFRVLTSRGGLQDQLADAARQDREALEAQQAADAALPSPLPVGDPSAGAFRFDLLALLQAGDCHASRDMLLPFLETVSFRSLEVVCDHVPRWFPMELAELGLIFEEPAATRPGEAMTLRITDAGGAWSQPPGRRPNRAGCQCGG